MEHHIEEVLVLTSLNDNQMAKARRTLGIIILVRMILADPTSLFHSPLFRPLHPQTGAPSTQKISLLGMEHQIEEVLVPTSLNDNHMAKARRTLSSITLVMVVTDNSWRHRQSLFNTIPPSLTVTDDRGSNQGTQTCPMCSLVQKTAKERLFPLQPRAML
jgi:hypothetical protein